MKIGLISPKSSFLGNTEDFQKFLEESEHIQTFRNEWSGQSVALSIIASLTPAHHNIEIIDENVESIDYTKEYDLVGITGFTQQATRAYQIADKWRKKSVCVVMGGIHASVMPDETKEHADSVVIGEAENIWGELLNDFENGTLKPFYKSDFPADLDKFPIPSYELLKNKDYKIHWVQLSRGCPFDCTFCAASKIYGYKYRVKSVERILTEIDYIRNIYPDTRISFADDNIFFNKRYSKELLRKLIPYKLRYSAQTDISVAEDDELLSLIKESGCTFLFIGLESLSEDNLEGIDRNNKKQKLLKRLPEYIQKIQSFGIGVMGAFIVGLENDTADTFNRIKKFVYDNTLYNVQITILTPLPGTEVREKLLKEKRLLNTDWENYTGFDVNFVHKNISKEQFEKGILKTYKDLNSKEYFLKKMLHFKKIHKKLVTHV